MNTVGLRLQPNNWVIAPVPLLDAPMRAKDFYKGEGDVEDATNYMSVRELCAKSNAEAVLSNDGRYFYFGFEASDLTNDITRAKAFAQENGLQLGGGDFTRTGDGLVWILNYSETLEFLKVNPMFQPQPET